MKKQVLFVAMSLLAVSAWGQNSGTCGESTTWRMGNGEVLFIEGTGATDGAFAEPDEIEEIRRLSEDENFSYETCLTARSHPSDVKEL